MVINNRLILLFLVFFTVSASAVMRDPSRKVNVVVSNYPLGSLVESIGKDKINLTIIAGHKGCPKRYDPRIDDINKMRRAALLVTIDKRFESYMKGPKQKMLYVSKIPGLKIIENRGKINWHVWFDFDNAQLIIKAVYERLSALSPGNKEYFLENYRQTNQRLIFMKKAMKRRAQEVLAGEKILSYDESTQYFFQNLGLDNITYDFIPKDLMGMKDADELEEMMKREKYDYFFVDYVAALYRRIKDESILMGFESEVWDDKAELDGLYFNHIENKIAKKAFAGKEWHIKNQRR